MNVLPGRNIGAYEIQGLIGQGGMGNVYRAVDTRSGQPAAIKCLRPEHISQDPSVIERFMREGEMLRKLDHPNIVKILETIEDDGQYSIVMEYVSGGSLLEALKRARLPLDRVLSIALDLADALTRVHRLGIVHRDLKPANVLLADNGSARLTDFGISYLVAKPHLTLEGALLGTPSYLSPEAWRALTLDARADIWSFGVLLFEMLAQQTPFSPGSPAQMMTAILSRPPLDLEVLRPDCPIALVDLVYRMLEKDREARLSSVRLVGAELEAILRGISVETGPMPKTEGEAGPDRSTTGQKRFATPTPTERPKHNLPAQTTLFVGRESELAELGHLLDNPDVRLVTILAPGGMGKTRLALETAHAALEQASTASGDRPPEEIFADGVYFVSLAPLCAPENILLALAEAVGFQFFAGGEPRSQLLDFFRERHLLLVMDNFEHLLAGAGLVSDILSAAPGVKVLATSRERLNLSGETVFNLGGMDFPAGRTLPEVLEYSAVKLFVQGARRAQPGFELKETDVPPVVRICQLVEGMPLGVLLAASWMGVLTPAEIADEIGKSLDFLETSARDLPERQRSLRTVFDYSWDMLAAPERTVFAKMSVFRGGFTREAIEAVAGANLRVLMALVNKSLLRRNPDSGRYEVHELLRQYATEKLEQMGEFELTVSAHCAYYARFAQQREADIKGRRQIAALNEIEADSANIRVMWEYAAARKNYAAIGQALDSLYLCYDMRSRAAEGVELFRSAAEVVASDPGDQARLIWGRLKSREARTIILGALPYQNDINALIETCLDIAQTSGSAFETAFCLFLKGMQLVNTNQVREARTLFEESYRLYHDLDDPYNYVDVSVWIAVTYELLHDYDRAVTYFKQCVQLQKEIGDRSGHAWTLLSLGGLYFEIGDWCEANWLVEKGLILMREKDDPKGIAMCSVWLGWISYAMGEFEKARHFFENAIQQACAISHLYIKADALFALSMITSILDENYARARQQNREAFALAHKLHGTIDYPNFALALAEFGLENDEEARRFFRETARHSGKLWRSQALCAAPLFLVRDGQPERAVEFLALIHTSPEIAEGWRRNWPLLNRLHEQVRNDLPPEVYTAAWERGAALPFDSAVDALRAI